MKLLMKNLRENGLDINISRASKDEFKLEVTDGKYYRWVIINENSNIVHIDKVLDKMYKGIISEYSK